MILLLAILLAQGQTVTKAGTTASYGQGVQGVTGGVALHTVCDSGCGGASAFLDLAAFSAGVTAINVAGGVFDDTLAAVVAGKAAAPRMTSKRALHFNIRDNSGNEIPFPAALAASGGMKVDVQNASIAVTQSTSPWVTADNHTTAIAPLSLRLSDGAAFYDARTIRALTSADVVTVANSFALDATLTGGTQQAQVKGGAKGATAAALVTSTANGADHQGLDVQVQNASVAVTQATPANLQATVTGAVVGHGTAATAMRVELPTDGTGVVGLNAGTALVGKVGLDQTTPGTTNAVSIAQIGATTVVNGGLAGSLAVGGTQGNNAAISANPILDGIEALSTQPTAATTGNARRVTGGLDGAIYVRPFTQQWSCGVTAIGATLTECKAAPASGLKAYVTDIIAISDTATAGQLTVRFGTGSNCATGTTTLFPKVASITAGKYPYPGNTAINPMYYSFATPLAPTAANAVCVICIATQTCTVTMIGYEAP